MCGRQFGVAGMLGMCLFLEEEEGGWVDRVKAGNRQGLFIFRMSSPCTGEGSGEQ